MQIVEKLVSGASPSIGRVSLLPVKEMEVLCKGANPANAVLVQVNPGTDHLLQFQVMEREDEALTGRNVDVIEYVRTLCSFADSLKKASFFIFQGDDRPINIQSASWQRRCNVSSEIIVLPDFYYTRDEGYQSFLPDSVHPWDERMNKAVWRGGTTGLFNQTIDDLAILPRYKLCIAGTVFGSKVDFGIYNIVQYRSEEDKQLIKQRLIQEGLFRSHMDLREFGKSKFIVQIDGNGNSWELVKKMRLGCCVVMVDSPWELWHNRYFKPWKHFVPVSHDLSDLEERLRWCFENDDECRSIAAAGRQVCMGIDFGAEMREACEQLLAAF